MGLSLCIWGCFHLGRVIELRRGTGWLCHYCLLVHAGSGLCCLRGQLSWGGYLRAHVVPSAEADWPHPSEECQAAGSMLWSSRKQTKKPNKIRVGCCALQSLTPFWVTQGNLRTCVGIKSRGWDPQSLRLRFSAHPTASSQHVC